MTDRELLELAAKAIGGELSEGTGRKRVGETWDQFEWIGPVGITTGRNWLPHPKVTIYPLEDDGDALRLAVKLSMTVDIYTARVEVRWYDDITSETFTVTEHDNNADNDLIAATRRAIVRAAAEIGKGL